MTKFTNSIILAGAVFAAIATPALASRSDDGQGKIEVKAAGYDLSTREGVSALTKHVRSAARQVCGVNDDPDLYVKAQASRCFDRAFSDANAQIEALRARTTGNRIAVADTGKISRPGE